MRSCVVVVLAVLATTPARADLAVKSESQDGWGAPLVALRRLRSFGGNTVDVVLYASGRIIYADRASHDQPQVYFVATLTPAERRALVGDLPLDGVGSFHPPGGGKDGVTYCIDAWTRGQRKTDCVWEWIEDSPQAAGTPPEMTTIWKRLAHFTSPRATVFVPKRVTVYVDPWWCPQTPPSTSLAWPARWPHGGQPRPPSRNAWSFTVGGDEVTELRRIRSRVIGQCQEPLLLDGNYFQIFFGFELPHESAWAPRTQP